MNKGQTVIKYATPERKARFIELWQTTMPRAEILEILEAMPGPGPIPVRAMKDWGQKLRVHRPLSFLTVSAQRGGKVKHDQAFEFARRSLAGEDVVIEGARSDWTSARIRQLADDWKAGCPTKEMGQRLGVTKDKIIGRVHQLISYGFLEHRRSPLPGLKNPWNTGRSRREVAEPLPVPRPLPAPINTLPPLPSGLEPTLAPEPPPRRPEPPIRRHDVLPVSGIQAPSRPRVAYGPPMPPPPRPAVPTELVEADWPTIRHWAAQRGLGDAMLEVINAKRVAFGLGVFVVETWRRVA